jgi:hypothetical protein
MTASAAFDSVGSDGAPFDEVRHAQWTMALPCCLDSTDFSLAHSLDFLSVRVSGFPVACQSLTCPPHC